MFMFLCRCFGCFYATKGQLCREIAFPKISKFDRVTVTEQASYFRDDWFSVQSTKHRLYQHDLEHRHCSSISLCYRTMLCFKLLTHFLWFVGNYEISDFSYICWICVMCLKSKFDFEIYYCNLYRHYICKTSFVKK